MKTATLISLASLALSASAKICKPSDIDYCDKKLQCIPKATLEAIVPKYVAAFAGIEDGGKQVREVFDENVEIYSQSQWWVSGAPDIIAAHAEKDDFPPILKGTAQMIQFNSRPYNPDAFIVGPVAYGCNTFSFYWKGDFSIPGIGVPRGRTNGIDMVFLDYKTGLVTTAYSEYNNLNQMYNYGAHLTWSENPTCCECPTPFDPSCKCPAAASNSTCPATR